MTAKQICNAKFGSMTENIFIQLFSFVLTKLNYRAKKYYQVKTHKSCIVISNLTLITLLGSLLWRLCTRRLQAIMKMCSV